MDLVTGATGSLGMHLVSVLLAAGREVRGMRRRESNVTRCEAFWDRKLGSESWREQFEWIEGDLSDGLLLEQMLLGGVKRVFHAAALVSFHPKDANRMMETNREGTARLVDAMLHAGTPELIHISSVAALGRKHAEPVHEETPYEEGPDVSAYGRSKHMAEREVWRGEAEGLKVVSLNPVIILGEGNYSQSSAALFTLVHRGLGWYPMGENGFVSAWDVARAALQLAQQGTSWGHRFVLCAENRSYQSILSTIAEAFDKHPPSKPLRPWMSGLAWRLAWIWERISGRKAVLTRESVANTACVHHYATQKLESHLTSWRYQPVDEVIAETAEAYLFSKSRS